MHCKNIVWTEMHAKMKENSVKGLMVEDSNKNNCLHEQSIGFCVPLVKISFFLFLLII